ncbi:MAG: UDP-glucose 4-epimerase GalE [Nanobdellota archaeon]
MEKILVTGGAGYIGSVAVKRLADKGYKVFVIDNLYKGNKDLIDKRAVFFHADLCDESGLRDVFNYEDFDAVIHFAAYKAAGESMKNAVKYSDNIKGTLNLLNMCVDFNVKRFIFSSSAGVYGDSDNVLDEDSLTNPINFYGFTKLECEKIIDWYNKIHKLSFCCLRYFNVAGDELGYQDPDAKNVFPIIMETIEGKKEEFCVFGNDYPTKDGSCIRDYIHISDLVDAHILALENSYNGILNLGSEEGFSVFELVKYFKEISGKDFKLKIESRREGDPAKILASSKKAKDILGWSPKKNIRDMVDSTIKSYKNI